MLLYDWFLFEMRGKYKRTPRYGARYGNCRGSFYVNREAHACDLKYLDQYQLNLNKGLISRQVMNCLIQLVICVHALLLAPSHFPQLSLQFPLYQLGVSLTLGCAHYLTKKPAG